MHTLFGKEAQDGDYVLVGHVQFGRSTVCVAPAQVVKGKAYAGRIIYNKQRWLRKLEAIIVIDQSLVSDQEKAWILANIGAKTPKDIGDFLETDISKKLL